ncbi:hypothetical protein PIB30_069466 [Stylosanthes scabra]|uniref:Uncharacterized protein n=1 Tax=Stylosanthes scabra TaxID=79078 RepID=A0ABU6UQE9_9FABA|nr:hypothetical protein [Stylosanthes scabra]
MNLDRRVSSSLLLHPLQRHLPTVTVPLLSTATFPILSNRRFLHAVLASSRPCRVHVIWPPDQKGFLKVPSLRPPLSTVTSAIAVVAFLLERGWLDNKE